MLSIGNKALLLAIALVCAYAAQAQIGAGPGAEPTELRSMPAERTVAAYADPEWAPPRTSWGDPSLAGTWSVDDMRGIPRERPEEFGERELLTDEEFLERARQDQGGRNRAEDTETFLRNEWGVRTFGFTSLVVDPPDGRFPPMTEAAARRLRETPPRGTFGPGPFNTFEDFSYYDRCITRGIFGSTLPSIYGNGIIIGQSPDSISITYEMIHDTRVIPLDRDRPGLDDGIRQYMGNARGYWEGDTLVVESRNFTDKTGVGTRGSHSDRLVLTERFRRVDPEMIELRATVDDPGTFTSPFTYRVMITRQPNYQVYEYSCHEGNGAVGHSLSGERAYEKRVAEAVANGLPVPPRAGSGNIYRAPDEGAEIVDINTGEVIAPE
jgi:hypothetical protein